MNSLDLLLTFHLHSSGNKKRRTRFQAKFHLAALLYTVISIISSVLLALVQFYQRTKRKMLITKFSPPLYSAIENEILSNPASLPLLYLIINTFTSYFTYRILSHSVRSVPFHRIITDFPTNFFTVLFYFI